ncbi:MAG TPA: sulfide/dihydroorotate dehydrogenase-like FAD/NAD-binding protein [Syntrophomonadaceae bacterium]|nr:sulfide/dihydroorotate dehydrogenase-like FAD/NAD-binding protein [Syntrophomonadaceae bacterium]
MFKITKKESLAKNIKLFDVYAPNIAKKAKPGQFVIVRSDEKGERIPLTIADYDRVKGTITIIFQEIGRSTIDLGLFEEGQDLLDFVGPLGRPSELERFGKVVCIGGGVGIAPIYPITRALYKADNYITTILGAQNDKSLFWENKLREVSNEVFITTDDGSYGEKGRVTDILSNIITVSHVDKVVAIGPLAMMEAISDLTRPKNIDTIVSLNPIMLDGTGMCGACRVEVGNETKFACVDGPEFDGHLVDWQNAKQRALMFKKEEEIALNYACNCHGKGESNHV